MANIGSIGPNESGASARSKINQAIAEANKVDGKANSSAVSSLQQALGDEITARQQAVTGEALARQQAIEAEAQARGSAVQSLQTQIGQKAGTAAVDQALAAERSLRQEQIAAEAHARAGADSAETAARKEGDEKEAEARAAGDAARITYVEHAADYGRPGEIPRLFTTDPANAPETAPTLPDTMRKVGASGAVVAIEGAGTVAPITVRRIEPGRQYRQRYVLQRAVDTEDPANDGIRLAIQWLRADKTPLSVSTLATVLDLTVSDGRQEYSYVVAASDAANVDFAAPAGAIYWRPFVRAFGTGTTHVEVIDRVDLTDAVNWSPDVSEFRRQLAACAWQIESVTVRMDLAEGQISASRDAAWFTRGTLDDERLSGRVVFRDIDEAIAGHWTYEDALSVVGPIQFGKATGGGPGARIVADGNYFSIAVTDKAGGFNTLREFFYDPDAANPHWTAEGDFEITEALIVGDAEASRVNLSVYSKAETDAKDQGLQDAIDAEAQARQDADAALQQALDEEISARETTDALLQDAIEAEATSRTDADAALQEALDAEAGARSDADAALQASVDAEAEARQAADTTLQHALAAEVTARFSADSDLLTGLTDEATAREAGDATLQAALDDEADARAAADSALQADIDLRAPLESPTFTGTVTLPQSVTGPLPTFADDAAAGTGGLTAGRWYATPTGELRIKL